MTEDNPSDKKPIENKQPIQLPNPDDDPANRDWIRTLAKRRRQAEDTTEDTTPEPPRP